VRYNWSWIEFLALMIAIFAPPTFLEQQYGTNWILGWAATALVVLPASWLYQRMRERQQGLALTSFAAYLRGFLGPWA
jgi:hypothetical protein